MSRPNLESCAMEMVFKCLVDGVRYFGVWQNGRELFVGSKEECGRYIEMRHAKVHAERLEEKRPFRNGPIKVRTYRTTPVYA